MARKPCMTAESILHMAPRDGQWGQGHREQHQTLLKASATSALRQVYINAGCKSPKVIYAYKIIPVRNCRHLNTMSKDTDVFTSTRYSSGGLAGRTWSWKTVPWRLFLTMALSVQMFLHFHNKIASAKAWKSIIPRSLSNLYHGSKNIQNMNHMKSPNLFLFST